MIEAEAISGIEMNTPFLEANPEVQQFKRVIYRSDNYRERGDSRQSSFRINVNTLLEDRELHRGPLVQAVMGALAVGCFSFTKDCHEKDICVGKV